MSKIIILDTETTGTKSSKHGIWQLGAIVEIDGEEVDSIKLEMNPGDVEFVEKALEVSNITKAEIDSMESSKSSFNKFIKFLDKHVDRFDKADKLQFVGYRADFDMNMVRAWFIRNEHKYFGSYFYQNAIDLFSVVGMILINHRHELENMKLGTICKLFEIDLENAHDALDDAYATYDLFIMIQENHIKL